MTKKLTIWTKSTWHTTLIIDGKKVDTFDLEDILLQIMNDEFSIMLEDKSEQHISKVLEQLFLDCTHGKYDLVQTLKQDSQKISGAFTSSKAQKGGDDDDDSSDDDAEEGEDMDVEMGEEAPEPVKKEKPEPIIDEDGFETVVKKGRRR